jgi:hypothetical protein
MLNVTVPIGGKTVLAVTNGTTPGSSRITPDAAVSAKFNKSIKSGVPVGGLTVPPAVKSTLKIGVMTVVNAVVVSAVTGGVVIVNIQLAIAFDQLSAIAAAPPVGGVSIILCMSDVS